MKVVDRKTFLQMPKGTVFCKFPRFNEKLRFYDNYPLQINEPQIKMCDCKDGDNDYDSLYLGEDLRPKGYKSDTDVMDTLMDMERNLGKEVPFGYSYGRDGMYETDDEAGFAIFSRAEVEEMITLLQQALRDGYKETN